MGPPPASPWGRPPPASAVAGSSAASASSAFPDLASAQRMARTRRARAARATWDDQASFEPYPSRVDEMNARASAWRRAGRSSRSIVFRPDDAELNADVPADLDPDAPLLGAEPRTDRLPAPRALHGMASITVRDQTHGAQLGAWASMFHTRSTGSNAPQIAAHRLQAAASPAAPSAVPTSEYTAPEPRGAPEQWISSLAGLYEASQSHAVPALCDALQSEELPPDVRHEMREMLAPLLIHCASQYAAEPIPEIVWTALELGSCLGRDAIAAWAPHVSASPCALEPRRWAAIVDGLTSTLSWHTSQYLCHSVALPMPLVHALSAAWAVNGERAVPLPAAQFAIAATSLPQIVREYMAYLRAPATGSMLIARPWLLTLAAKTQIIAWEAQGAMRQASHDAWANEVVPGHAPDATVGTWRVSVSRTTLVDDSLEAVRAAPAHALHRPLQVTFRDEPAQDAGGLRKEWLQLLCEALQRESAWADLGASEPRMQGLLYLRGAPPDEQLEKLELLGTALGLALFHQITLPLHFPRALYALLLALSQGHAAPCDLTTLAHLKPALAAGLARVRTLEAAELAEAHLTWQVDTPDGTSELVPLGSTRVVRVDDRDAYVARLCEYVLLDEVRAPWAALARGFARIVAPAGGAPSPLALLSAAELELLLCGREERELDLEALRASTEHVGFPDRYAAGAPRVYRNLEHFWSVWARLPPDEQHALLGFITGCVRVPALGASALGLRIQHVDPAAASEARVPWSSTCTSTLFLPVYGDADLLEAKLRIALRHSTGFGLG
ncbi:HECT-type E3 ubiquitin transferase [Malassezia caprae]|uniref:HECT-type E3 ubiquitin transferase n=1 Tax=Malassezia caprae TaxID=1381934 RepID=A0AAF0E3X6_9BASI|nr:HECT-type E3 ubiquitin transferase [Malassezia caprae]